MSADLDQEASRHAAQAQRGLRQIEEAILALLGAVPGGRSNAEIARELGLETGGTRGQKNYLTWSILQEMIVRKTVSAVPSPIRKREILYVLPRE